MPDYERQRSEEAGSGRVRAGAPEVTWPAGMLECDPEGAAAAFDRAIGGLARRLSPGEAARFLFALDSALYARLGVSAIAAEGSRDDGREAVHPKHRLTRYHDFFVGRVRPGERVADLGCGPGVLATALAVRAGADVTGVDMSAASVEAARRRSAERGAAVRYVVADILDLAGGREIEGLGSGFETVVLSNVLEHLCDRPRVLRGVMARLGASRLLLRVPAYERDWRVAYKRDLGVEWRLDPTHAVEHTREELEGELEEAGVRVEGFEVRWGEYYVVGTV